MPVWDGDDEILRFVDGSMSAGISKCDNCGNVGLIVNLHKQNTHAKHCLISANFAKITNINQRNRAASGYLLWSIFTLVS